METLNNNEKRNDNLENKVEQGGDAVSAVLQFILLILGIILVLNAF